MKSSAVGGAAVGALPAAVAPVAEDVGERRVDGHAAWDLGLSLVQVEPTERLQVRVVLAPAQRRGLAVPEPRERLERVNDAAVFEDANVGDERLHFFAREDRVRSKGASWSMFFGRMPFASTHGVNGISSSATAVRNMQDAVAQTCRTLRGASTSRLRSSSTRSRIWRGRASSSAIAPQRWQHVETQAREIVGRARESELLSVLDPAIRIVGTVIGPFLLSPFRRAKSPFAWLSASSPLRNRRALASSPGGREWERPSTGPARL